MHVTNGRIKRFLWRAIHVFLWVEDTLSTCDQLNIISQTNTSRKPNNPTTLIVPHYIPTSSNTRAAQDWTICVLFAPPIRWFLPPNFLHNVSSWTSIWAQSWKSFIWGMNPRKYTYFTRPTTNFKKEGAQKPKPLSCPQEKYTYFTRPTTHLRQCFLTQQIWFSTISSTKINWISYPAQYLMADHSSSNTLIRTIFIFT